MVFFCVLLLRLESFCEDCFLLEVESFILQIISKIVNFCNFRIKNYCKKWQSAYHKYYSSYNLTRNYQLSFYFRNWLCIFYFLFYFLNQIANYFDNYHIYLIMSFIHQYWEIYKKAWNLDSTQEPIYLATRDHAGSYVAIILSIYNVFLVRQNILKNAIHITKSNNPKIVKFGSFLVGSFYFIGLYLLWNIPCFFTQIAVRSYCASQTAMTNILLQKNLKQSIFSEKRVKDMLQKEGLKI